MKARATAKIGGKLASRTDVAVQLAYLKKADKQLAAVIAKIPPWAHSGRGVRPNHFKALVVAMVNQQLSGKAADTIFKRFEALFAEPKSPWRIFGAKKKYGAVAPRSMAKKFPSPEAVLAMSRARMRRAGLSRMKIEFIKDLARNILDGTVNFRAMKMWSDEEVIEHLTRVKGIGRWTAEMFLMFSLGREDVFSYGDLGLRNAMQRLYKLPAPPTPQQAARISGAWRPYRSLASRYLWRSLEVE